MHLFFLKKQIKKSNHKCQFTEVVYISIGRGNLFYALSSSKGSLGHGCFCEGAEIFTLFIQLFPEL